MDPIPYHHRLQRADALNDLGRPEQALEQARAAVALDPSAAEAWFQGGRALLALDRLDEAADWIGKGLARAPESTWGLALESWVRSSQGDHAGALASAAAGLKLDPEHPGLHLRRAACLGALERLTEAREAARQATVLDPGSVHAWVLRARIALALQADEEARRSARKAAELGPQEVGALTALGTVLATTGDIDGGIEVYRRALAAAPSSREAQEGLLRLVERGPLAASEGVTSLGRFLLFLGLLVGLSALCQGQWLGVACPAAGLVLLYGSGSLVRLSARLSLEERHPGAWALYRKLAAERRRARPWWRRVMGPLLP